jgi:hypothetical protein
MTDFLAGAGLGLAWGFILGCAFKNWAAEHVRRKRKMERP